MNCFFRPNSIVKSSLFANFDMFMCLSKFYTYVVMIRADSKKPSGP